MILCVDIGNTNITLGIYDNEFIETVRLASDKELSEAQYELLIKTITKNYKISGGKKDLYWGEIIVYLQNEVIFNDPNTKQTEIQNTHT